MEMRLLFCCLFSTVVVAGRTQGFNMIKEADEQDEDRFWDCVSLRDAFYYAVHDYILPTMYGVGGTEGNSRQMAAAKERLQATIGVNVDSLQDIQRMACRIVGVETIRQLSDVLELDHSYLRELYQVSVAMIEGAPGGVDSYVRSWQVTVQLGDFFRNSEYPNWPLGVSLVDSFYLTYGLIREYGPEFLKPFRPWEKMEVNSLLLTTALADATRIEEFQELSELSDATLHILVAIADKTTTLSEQEYQQFLRSGNAYSKFLQVCERLGLLRLREGDSDGDDGDAPTNQATDLELEQIPLEASV